MKGKKKTRVLRFKSEEDYKKWLAYNYIHNKKKMGKPPHAKIIIRGKPHKVKHKKK